MKRLIPLIAFLFIYSFTFSQITFSINTQQTTCSGNCNGTATITPLSGTPPYNYWWNGAVLSSNLTNLCVGQYSVLVTDANLISDIAIVNITSLPGGVTATTTHTNSTKCSYPGDGIADITANNGVAPYTFDWSDGTPGGTKHNVSPYLTNIMAGTYSYTVTDAVGCMFTNTFNILLSSYPSFSVTTTQINATCNGICNGSANIFVNGTPGPFIYTIYSSFNSYSVTTASLTNLCTGTYSISVTDSISGCVADNSMLYISNNGNSSIPNTFISSISNDETCFQSNDGSIDLNISGSNIGPFTFLWSNGATTQDIYNLQSNIYSVTITDANSNCTTILDTVSSLGINCGSIFGNIFIDNNSDCIKNSGDNNFNGAMVMINPGNRIGYANAIGDYVINSLPYGTYSICLQNSSGSVFPTCTATLNTTVYAGNQNSINNNLSVGFGSVIQPDLQVSAWNQGVVPGFISRMNYQLININNVNASGVYKVTLPSAFIPNITNATSGYSISGDTVIWVFSNIVYSTGSLFYFIDFTVPLSTPLGSTFVSCISAQPIIADYNYANNINCYQRMVTGSFDPNEKTVSPVGVGANGDIAAAETDLTYLIRFQNTGNGPAVNIVVKDTLSSNVDVKTFEMLSSSHNYNIDILPGNVLRWKFNNIMLPDSNSNEPESHGYIQYRIKRTNNNTPGTQIKNTAYIYFDFNEPVVTNTAINTIETLAGIKSQSHSSDMWNIYPNPSKGVLYLVNASLVKEESQIQVLNSIGQTVLEEAITSNYKNIDLSKLDNGVYFVKIVSDKQTVVKRIVLSK